MSLPYRQLPPGVRRFRLDPARHRSAAVRVFLRRSAFALSTSPLLAGAVYLNHTNVDGLAVVGLCPAVLIVLAAVVKLARLGDSLSPELRSYELMVSDRVFRRAGIGPVAEVLRPEVAEMVETTAGLWVSCTTPRRSLFVSRAVDGYADVRQSLSAWGPIQSLGGWRAIWRARRERMHQGPRDAVLGTALEGDKTLATELEAVRAAAAEGQGAAALQGVAPRGGRVLALWVALIVMFLAIWQVLQPRERRPTVTTDETCRARPSCKAWGLCTASDARCVAGSDEDCLRSEGCAKLGRCTKVGESCYGEKDPDSCRARWPQ